MVYDAFMFFDELDLLEIRMNILDPVVDYFVITEATTTQMGKPKRMIFKENEDRYIKFRDKIIYNPVDDKAIEFENQWEREAYQKNACIKGLKNCEPDDIVVFSDLDEIPDPVKIQTVIDNFDPDVIYHFAQELFYFFINYKNVDHTLLSACGDFPDVSEKKWLGSKLCSYKVLSSIGCDEIRHPVSITKTSIRIDDGGWHFSYMGGDKKNVQQRVKSKLSAFSHSEFNSWRYYSSISIWISVLLGKDLMGRNARFKKVRIDESYPEWIQKNYKNYPHFIL